MKPRPRLCFSIVVLVAVAAVVVLALAADVAATTTPAHGSKGRTKPTSSICAAVPKCSNLCPFLSTASADGGGCDLVTTPKLEERLDAHSEAIAVYVHTRYVGDAAAPSCSQQAYGEPSPTSIGYGCYASLDFQFVYSYAICPSGYQVAQNSCWLFEVYPGVGPRFQMIRAELGECNWDLPAPGETLRVVQWTSCRRVGNGVASQRQQHGGGGEPLSVAERYQALKEATMKGRF